MILCLSLDSLVLLLADKEFRFAILETEHGPVVGIGHTARHIPEMFWYATLPQRELVERCVTWVRGKGDWCTCGLEG